jgi:LysR family transcriptional regulator, cyn operon transcriptional activator
MTIDLRQLRYLITVAEEANFTRAAETLYVTQSALSQQIQTLEKAVGVALLDRSKRGVRLTAAGSILVSHAQRMLLELDKAQIALQELEGLQRGSLRIGVVQTINEYLMPSIIGTFVSQYPRIKLLVEERSTDDIEAGLESGEFQVGLSFIPTNNAIIDSTFLFEEQLILVVRRDHPLAQVECLLVKALDELPMVMLSRTYCTRHLWEDTARLAGAHPQVMMELNTVSGILAAVAQTGLATVLPGQVLAARLIPDLVGIPLHNPLPSRQVGVLWNRDFFVCSASRKFIELTQTCVSRLGNPPLPQL